MRLVFRICARGCLFGLIALAMLNGASAANTYSGGLSNGYYRFFRPATLNSQSAEQVPFHAIYFTVQGSSPGNVTATVSGNGFTPRVHFYQNGTFDPYAPNNNLWWLGTGTVTATNLAHGVEIPHLLIVSGTTASDVGSFTVTLTGPGPISIAPDNDSALVIRTQPQNKSISAGQSSVVRVWASGRQPQKFQWYYGPKPVGTNAPDPTKLVLGATNQSYFTPVLNQTTNYWCLINGINTTPTSARSSLATVNVAQMPATFNGSLTTQHDTWNRMTTNNVLSGQICYFEVVPFKIFSAGSYTIALNTVGFPGSINLYSGKFFPSTPAVNFLENGVFDNAAGALSYVTTLQPGDYEMVISSASGGQVGTYSGQITGPSVPQMLPRPTLPVFLNLPKDRTIPISTSVTLSFSVEGALPRTNQWFRGMPGDASQPIAGATGKSYTTPLLPNVGTNFYWVRVANSYGATTSGPVRVKVVNGPITFGSKLRPGNKTFKRSNGAGGMEPNFAHYKTYVFEAPVPGTYKVALESSNVSVRASVYQSIFMTNNPNVNLYLLPFGYDFDLNVVAPSTFWLVISTTNLSAFGSYSGTITGPGGALVNELPAPIFAPQPTPTNQFLWPNEDPLPIIGNANPVESSWSWFHGVSPGVPVDFTTSIPGLNTRTNDQPANVTAKPTNLWYWARIDGSYGYDDSELCMLEVSPPPRFLTYPTNRSIVYGNTTNLTTIVTNVPFLVRWYRGISPNPTNTVQSDVIQGYGASYTRAVSKTNTVPILDVGTYSYWLQSTNPSGVTNGPTFAITVTKRPLFVSLSTPQGLTPYDGLPHPAGVMAFDLTPGGPPVPNPLPIIVTYQLPGGPAVTNEPVNAGTYQVIATIDHPNYVGAATNSYTIIKRSLIARADDKFRQYGAANPRLTISYTNFATGDTSASLDAPPTIATFAGATSPKGQYPITLAGGADNNYTFTLVNGTLTVLGLPVAIAHSTDFASNAPAAATLKGNAVLTNNLLRLTDTNSNENGEYLVAPKRPLRNLYAEFVLGMTGLAGSGGGFSFNYGVGETNVAQEGVSSGLSVLVDTFSDNGETVPNISVKHSGALLTQVVVPAYNPASNRFILDVSPAGALALKLNGVTVTNVALPGWEPLPEWQLILAAGTPASLPASHTIANLLVGDATSHLLLPANSCQIAFALSPAFSGTTNIVHTMVSNSNPMFATATLETNGFGSAMTTNGVAGSSRFTFRGTNASVDARLFLDVSAIEGQITSITAGPNGTAQIKLKGPAKARYYLQQSSELNSGPWTTCVFGTIDSEGFASADVPAPATPFSCYRVQFSSP